MNSSSSVIDGGALAGGVGVVTVNLVEACTDAPPAALAVMV